MRYICIIINQISMNKTKPIRGFRDSYDAIRKGKERFLLELARLLNVGTARQARNYVDGKVPMTVAQWAATKKLLEKYGATRNKSASVNTMVTLEGRIEAEILDMWDDERRNIAIEIDGDVFEVSVEVTDFNEKRFVKYLEIDSEYNTERLVNKIINKEY